jgi:hypothetical protein
MRGGGTLLVEADGVPGAKGSLRDPQGRTEVDVQRGRAETATVTIPSEASSGDGRLVLRLSTDDVEQTRFWLRIDALRIEDASAVAATG